jgi:FKBP-type peptidyl-prolyl cis-trans isomerase
MRRLAAALVVPLIAAAALAGCGSSGPSASNSSSMVKVSGAFGQTPKVTIPAVAPDGKTVITTPIKGTGTTWQTSNNTISHVTVYVWSGKTHKLLNSSKQLIPPDIGLAGLKKALTNAKMGSRVVAVLPPKEAWGKTGDSQLGVTGTDTTVWVIDLQQTYAPNASATGTHVSNGGGKLPTVSAATGTEPKITMPKASPPSDLTVTTLEKGSGPKLVTGDLVLAQYVGAVWRDGKVFNATWPPRSSLSDGEPYAFQLGGQVIAGWNKGLVGVPVGSRVMVTIPPADGYGKKGQPSVGIKGTDTLVFVIDVLASVPQAQTG